MLFHNVVARLLYDNFVPLNICSTVFIYFYGSYPRCWQELISNINVVRDVLPVESQNVSSLVTGHTATQVDRRPYKYNVINWACLCTLTPLRGWVYKRRFCSCAASQANSGTGLSQALWARKNPAASYNEFNSGTWRRTLGEMKLLLYVAVALISIGAAVGQAPFFDHFSLDFNARSNLIQLECLNPATGQGISGSRFFANISNVTVPVGPTAGTGTLQITITQDTEGFYFCQSNGVNSSNSDAIAGKYIRNHSLTSCMPHHMCSKLSSSYNKLLFVANLHSWAHTGVSLYNNVTIGAFIIHSSSYFSISGWPRSWDFCKDLNWS